MFILISYDITDTKRRNKVCNTLKNYGTHVQYSVFECLLNNKQMIRLKNRLLNIIDQEHDKLRIYQMCESCKRNILTYGAIKITEDEEIYIV